MLYSKSGNESPKRIPEGSSKLSSSHMFCMKANVSPCSAAPTFSASNSRSCGVNVTNAGPAGKGPTSAGVATDVRTARLAAAGVAFATAGCAPGASTNALSEMPKYAGSEAVDWRSADRTVASVCSCGLLSPERRVPGSPAGGRRPAAAVAAAAAAAACVDAAAVVTPTDGGGTRQRFA